MGFNKVKYRKRREKNLRGQGDAPKVKGAVHAVVDWPAKDVSTKARKKNTRRARMELEDDGTLE